MKKNFLKIITVVLSLVMFVNLLPICTFAEDDDKQYSVAQEDYINLYSSGYGLIWDDEEIINSIPVASASLINTTKTQVDLTNKFPKPGYQGTQQSCVGWAVAYLKSGQETIKRGWSSTANSHMFSPSFIYNQLNGGKDEGLSIPEAMNFAASSGICSINYFPFKEADYTTQPSGIAKAAASLYKSTNVQKVIGVQATKNAIANNQGVILGIRVYPDLTNLSKTNQIYDSLLGVPAPGGHAICLIGFDDSKGAFKFINSWGTNWGIDGYGWIKYSFVENLLVNRHGAGFIMSNVEDDYILGDINGDGKISIVDSKNVLQYISGEKTLSNRQIALADVNGDAKVTTVDSKNILQYVSKEITKMPLYN